MRLRTANRLAAADLYEGVVWVKNPALFHLGMQDQWFTFNMFHAQAWWVRDAIMARISISDGAMMRADIKDRSRARMQAQTTMTRSSIRPTTPRI